MRHAITTSRAPACAESSMSASSIGTSASVPSIENRFMFTHARPMNRSRPSTALRRSSTRASLPALGIARDRSCSIVSRNHSRSPFFAEVRELEAHRGRVEIAKSRGDVGGRADIEAERERRDELQVGFGDAVELGRQLCGAGRRRAERIELYGEVAVLADRVDERGGAGDLAKVDGIGGDGRRRRCRRRRAARRSGRTGARTRRRTPDRDGTPRRLRRCSRR